GGKHAGAGTAGRAGGTFDRLNVRVRDTVVGGGNHRVHQIERLFLATKDNLAGFHRTTGDEDRRDVEAHGCHQHTGGNLVTVGDADHCVGAMGIDHVLY